MRGKDEMLTLVTGASYCSRKYLIEEGTIGYDMIPMLRLSELYYIVGEYYARNNQLDKAGAALEMRKELIGEGQLYFLYKRLNMKEPFDMDEKNVNFVFEHPENEDI